MIPMLVRHKNRNVLSTPPGRSGVYARLKIIIASKGKYSRYSRGKAISPFRVINLAQTLKITRPPTATVRSTGIDASRSSPLINPIRKNSAKVISACRTSR